MAIGAGFGVCTGPRSMLRLGACAASSSNGLPSLPFVDFVMTRSSPSLSDAGRIFAEVSLAATWSRFGAWT